jgi:hypothetical protein
MAVLEPRIKLLNQEPMRYMVDVENSGFMSWLINTLN